MDPVLKYIQQNQLKSEFSEETLLRLQFYHLSSVEEDNNLNHLGSLTYNCASSNSISRVNVENVSTINRENELLPENLISGQHLLVQLKTKRSFSKHVTNVQSNIEQNDTVKIICLKKCVIKKKLHSRKITMTS